MNGSVAGSRRLVAAGLLWFLAITAFFNAVMLPLLNGPWFYNSLDGHWTLHREEAGTFEHYLSEHPKARLRQLFGFHLELGEVVSGTTVTASPALAAYWLQPQDVHGFGRADLRVREYPDEIDAETFERLLQRSSRTGTFADGARWGIVEGAPDATGYRGLRGGDGLVVVPEDVFRTLEGRS